MLSVSAGHIILTPTQPVGSGRPQRVSNPGTPQQIAAREKTQLITALLATLCWELRTGELNRSISS